MITGATDKWSAVASGWGSPSQRRHGDGDFGKTGADVEFVAAAARPNDSERRMTTLSIQTIFCPQCRQDMLPDERAATKYVKINVEPHDNRITVAVFAPWGSCGIYGSEDINGIAKDASSRAGCIRRWSSRQHVMYTGVGREWRCTFRDPLPLAIGPRMAEALEFIRMHPGVSMVEVYRNCAGHPKPFGGRPNYLHRLINRGLANDRGPCNRAELYAWDVPDDDRNRPHGQERDNSDLPDGMWSPEAHP